VWRPNESLQPCPLRISQARRGASQAFARDRKLHFALLSDFEPKGDVAKSYGAYRSADGVAERALFLIDEKGMIVWSYCSPIAVNPGADGILDALEALPSVEKKHDPAKSAHNVA
jgi:peroxiredoxin